MATPQPGEHHRLQGQFDVGFLGRADVHERLMNRSIRFNKVESGCLMRRCHVFLKVGMDQHRTVSERLDDHEISQQGFGHSRTRMRSVRSEGMASTQRSISSKENVVRPNQSRKRPPRDLSNLFRNSKARPGLPQRGWRRDAPLFRSALFVASATEKPGRRQRMKRIV